MVCATRSKRSRSASRFRQARVHPTAGAIAVGARPLLIAFNVNLATDDVDVAKTIARAVRGRDGGLRYVKALGFRLRERDQVQVSMNLVDYEATPIFRHSKWFLAKRSARRVVAGSEIVGLVPQDALDAAAIITCGLKTSTRNPCLRFDSKTQLPMSDSNGKMDRSNGPLR